mgnify:CR=1 FL=1
MIPSPYLIGGAALAIMAAITYHVWTVSSLEEDVHYAEQETAQCLVDLGKVEGDRDKLKGAVERQNAAAEALAGECRSEEADANRAASDVLADLAEARRLDAEDPTTGPERMNAFMMEAFP